MLIEAGPRILSPFPENLSRKAQRQLEELGVEVRTGTPVSEVNATFVEIGNERIPARTVLCAAGVRASALTANLGVPIDRLGRVWVEEDLSVPDRRELFVTGDLVAKTQDGKLLPGVAQLALQTGRCAAKNIELDLRGLPRRNFRYRDMGSMATIGRHRAVAKVGRFEFSGVIAWWLWLVVHVLGLVEFRRRLAVLSEWAWAYFTWQRRSRVILEVPVEPPSPRSSSYPAARPSLRTGS